MDNLSNQENIGQTDLSGYESGTGSGNESTIADQAYRAKDKVATQGRRAVEKVDASRRPTADALERAASGIHDSADRTSQKAAGVAHRAADKLQATADYVRENDLRAMAKDGLLMRARRGAILPAQIGHEPSYSEKARQAAAEKASIARVAVEMIRPGDSILLGPGTTTQALAKLLVDFPELTVVTNSLLVAQALMGSSRVEVILTGGTLRRSIHALVGPATEESVRALRASLAFISGNGFSAERGLSTPSPLVAATDRAFASAAQQVIRRDGERYPGGLDLCLGSR